VRVEAPASTLRHLMDNLAIRVRGPETGPPLILANALGTSSEMWAPQIPALIPRYRVITYEPKARPTVEALADDVLELARRLDLGSFSFCGLSLGAMVGIRLALSAPESLGCLVLACTSARFGTPAEWHERADLVGARGLEAVAHDALAKWFTPDFADVAPFLEMQLATPRADYALGLEAIAGFDVREELGAVRAPTLVIAGAEDTATTAADAAFLAEHIPGARLVLIEGAAHLANVEQADEFNGALLAHLDRWTTRTR